MEFRDFRATSMDQLPAYDSHESGAIDHFGYYGRSSFCCEKLSLPFFVKISTSFVLVLSHSYADPEHLFTMVRKIETEERHQLDPSTICDLFSVKLNNYKPCYSNQHLMEDTLLRSVYWLELKFTEIGIFKLY